MTNLKIQQAIDFANEKHQGQVWKSPMGDKPYTVHTAGVANILERAGYKDEVIIAGHLHDTVEDTSTTFKELRTKFGKKVAELVAGVTQKGEGITWDERLAKYIEKVKKASPETKAVAAADKIFNMNDMSKCLDEGFDIFKYMYPKPQAHVNKFKTLFDILAPGMNETLKVEYKQALERLIKAIK